MSEQQHFPFSPLRKSKKLLDFIKDNNQDKKESSPLDISELTDGFSMEHLYEARNNKLFPIIRLIAGRAKKECYPLIPMTMKYFLLVVVEALVYYTIKVSKKCEPKFLEIGAGVALNKHIVESVGFVYVGLEINKKLCKLADDSSVINIDAIEYDNYDQYDVIYSWLPHENRELNRNMYDKIIDGMKKKAILICMENIYVHYTIDELTERKMIILPSNHGSILIKK